jgi:hypothetical protein
MLHWFRHTQAEEATTSSKLLELARKIRKCIVYKKRVGYSWRIRRLKYWIISAIPNVLSLWKKTRWV